MASAQGDSSGVVVALCGGGNAVHVLAGLLGANPSVKSVTILNLLETECVKLQHALSDNDHKITCRYKDGREDITGTVAAVTTDAAECIPTADIIVIAIPAFVHDLYLSSIASLTKAGAVVGVMVGQGGVNWAFRAAFGARAADVAFFALETLPWACRLERYGAVVDVLATKRGVDVAVMPEGRKSEVMNTLARLWGVSPLRARHHAHPPARGESDPEHDNPLGNAHAASADLVLESGVSQPAAANGLAITENGASIGPDGAPQLLPALHPEPNFLSCTLMNINSVWHPCICYGRFARWDGKTPFKTVPLFYEGVDEFAAAVLTNVSNEVLAVRDAVLEQAAGAGDVARLDLSKVTHVGDWVRRTYAGDIADDSTLMSCIRTNAGYKGLTHGMRQVKGGYVPDTSHRYFREDVPFGLLVTRGIAELAAVETPAMDRVLLWAQRLMGRSYLVGGRVAGKDVVHSRAPQKFGMTCVADIL